MFRNKNCDLSFHYELKCLREGHLSLSLRHVHPKPCSVEQFSVEACSVEECPVKEYSVVEYSTEECSVEECSV